MNDSKLVNLRREYGCVPFAYEPLTAGERQCVFSKLARVARLPGDVPVDDISKAIGDLGKVLFGLDATVTGFDFLRVVSRLGIQPTANIYLDEMNSRAMDRLVLEDLCKYFDDLWYPSSDDLLILDCDVAWFFLITHYGEVRFCGIVDHGCSKSLRGPLRLEGK